MKEKIREEIIAATIECIEEEGVHNVTVRKIAQKAGVNSAAVNYYFGSKENLIKATLEATFEEGFVNNLQNYEELWEKDPKKALYGFFGETMQSMVEYQELTKAHFFEVLNREQHTPESMEKLNGFLANFYSLLESILPAGTVKEKKYLVIQIMSAVFLPGLFPDLFRDFLEGDFSQKETRDKYIKTIVELFTRKPKTPEKERGKK